MLLLVGCTPQDEGEVPRTKEEFRHGTQGIEIELLESAPPKSVMEETPFEIIPKIMNKGAYDSTRSYLTLTLERDYIDVNKKDCKLNETTKINPCYTQDLGAIRGKGIVSPNGANIILDPYLVKSKKVGTQTSKYVSTALMSVCYEYQTILSGDICIDPDLYGREIIEKVCQMNDLSFSDQGAPIAIKEVRTNIIPHDNGKVIPEFTIEIENVGRGNALAENKIKDACTSAPMDREKSWNIITLKQIKVGEYFGVSNSDLLTDLSVQDNKITCKKFDAKLVVDKGTFICRFKEPIDRNDPAFSTQFEITLEYGYMKSISKNVEIERGGIQ